MNNNFKNVCLFAALVLFTINTYGQSQGDVFRQYVNAPVTRNGSPMSLPWTGGANKPQLAMADLNQDGVKDIVLFEDYIGVKTLIATTATSFRYDPSYEANFPAMNGYFTLIDFNKDDVVDLVHRSFAGVGVYYGYYSNSQLKFKYYKDLYYTNATGQVNVHVAPASIPAFGDVDNDGDIDIISYDVWGTQITFNRNCQKEDGLPKDSIKICVKDECWGRTYQNFERKVGLNYSCSQWGVTCKGCGSPSNKGTHGSNTLCLIDMDNDGDLDYFNGNESFSDIQFFYNGRNMVGYDSVIHEDTIWNGNGVDMVMHSFPAAFVLDVDHDNDDDLLFTPTALNSENYNCISYYKNTGSNANKNYVHQSDNFLVDQMIDMGMGSYPVLYDFDKDGKKDLFVGSDGFFQNQTSLNKSKIAYYRNTSSNPKSYSFELMDSDFLGLDSMGYMGAALAIGDLDNDSLDDLVIGRSDGTFAFFKNTAASDTVAPVWVLADSLMKDLTTFKTLDVGDYATPCIYDIDNDGKMDLISGNQLGDLYYYNNFGSVSGNLNVKFVTANLGGVKISDPFEPYAYSAPYIGPMDNTQIDYLVVGCEWGELYRFDGFQNGAMPAQYTMLDSVYSYINVGKRSAPAFANLDKDNDNLYEMIIGNVLGGLNFYKQDYKVHVNDRVAGNKNVRVYPNPAGNVLNVKWDESFADGTVMVQIISVTGQQVLMQSFDSHKNNCSLSLNELSSGTYYCIIQSGGNKSVQPVTVLR
ncbi:MAG: T9SS type A sorting domain-containing protein [Chitinophagales bacterium]|nr:T9SS type A sorting domain-containing protein [Chitinophagales bacterium]